MRHRYQVTLRIHDGWEYNDPKGYSTKIAYIMANNKDEAFAKAQRIAESDDKYEVTVLKKDIVRINEKTARKPYTVSLEFLYHTEVTILAHNATDAAEAAREMTLKEIFGRIRRIGIGELEDGQVTCVTDPDGNNIHF